VAKKKRILLILVFLLATLNRNSQNAHGQGAGVQYGLEWPGDGAVRRMLFWHNPFPIYDATYIFKVYPRKKTAQEFKYYTTFFWGNDGTYTWDNDNPNTYYGAHPYPVPAPNGPGQWEISVQSNDFTTGNEVEWNRWHTQAFRAWRESPTITHHEFYYDLPDTTKVIEWTVDHPDWAIQNPPTPAIVIGQAPNLDGQSWAGYPGWEEFNGIIRGIQIYSGLLTLNDIQAELQAPASTVAGQNRLWYLNLDPRPGDVSDKKGIGVPHNPSWDGETALEWANQTSPDTTPPAVTIEAPAHGSSAEGWIAVTASASDNIGVVGVQFKLDGANLSSEDTSEPYSVLWNTRGVANGPHTLTAIARDAAGNQTTATAVEVTVSNDSTQVTVTSPASGAIITSNSVQVTATVSRHVLGVQFKLDGANLATEDTSAPYSVLWDTTAAANGPHTLVAVAREVSGDLIASPAIDVTVNRDTAPPVVSMIEPADGATVSGLAVTVSASATDGIGVVGVQFKLDGHDLGAEDTTSPYSISWNPSQSAVGTHTLTAIARDEAGNQTTAGAITVRIRRASQLTSD
jgi:hypothetical protein